MVARIERQLVAWPLWRSALVTYIAVRLLALPAVLLTSTGGSKSVLDWFSSVDGIWYERVASDGYPSYLPVDATGTARPSTLAFYPVFPTLVRGLMAITGLPFNVVAPLTAFALGGAAMVMVAFLIRVAAPVAVAARPALPLIAVAALNAFPTGAVFNFAYTEGTALLLIAATLYLINRRHYLWAVAPVLILGLTRAVAVPAAGVVIWHAICRYRAGDRLSLGEWVKLTALFAASLASGVLWPLIVGRLTGDGAAFFKTQNYWRNGGDASVPFDGFYRRLSDYLPSVATLLLIALMIAVVVALSFTKRVVALGPELQSWGAGYLLFLIVFSDLDSSGLRFMLLTISVPLLLVSWWRKRLVGYSVLVLMLLVQYAWVYLVWGDRISINP